jgi:hypothetical protein
MTDRDAIDAAMNNVMWARRHVIPLRGTSEVADAALDSLDTCMAEFQEALRPDIQYGGRLARAVPTTLREIAKRLNSLDDKRATLARSELLEANRHLESEAIKWAAIS